MDASVFQACKKVRNGPAEEDDVCLKFWFLVKFDTMKP